MGPVLCDKCMHMFHDCTGEDGQHHPDLTSFTKAAAMGCYICEPLLEHALTNSSALKNCIVKPYTYSVVKCITNSLIYIHMTMLKDGKETRKTRAFEAVPNSEITTNLAIRHRISTIPILDATQTALRWMAECLKGHKKCQKNTQPRSYPTRLLQVGDSTIRLVLPAETTLSGPYAALSYCWGLNPTFYRLTNSNFHELQTGILCTELPIAFQEAIHFIKSLSIQYLWIDSLCIIQSGLGSTEDWRSESAKMKDVYSNCILNLSLNRAAHPNESCLRGRTHDATPPFGIEINRTELIANGGSGKNTYIILSHDYYREALHTQPLGFRAWALQERLLPPRVLSFGLGELFWGCKKLPIASESFPTGFTCDSESYTNRLILKSSPNTPDRDMLDSAWRSILEEYTSRELTYPEADKLVAMSAVAKQMEYAMNDVYIAGHFWKTLPLSLNWKVNQHRPNRVPKRINGPSESDKGQRQNKTPSWSWASMDGPLFPNNCARNTNLLADAEGYQLTLVDDTNSTGNVAFASLTIQVYCTEMEVSLEKHAIPSITKTWIDDDHEFEVIVDDPDDKLANGARYLLALLAEMENNWSYRWEGLVLEEVKSEGGARYRRIGHFALKIFKMEVRNQNNIKSVFGEEKKRIILI